MNRADLQHLANGRILDASILLDGGRWSFAFYVAGYAVECALKSCFLARMTETGWVFQERAKIDDCLTHDFGKLIQLSGLTGELNAACETNPGFAGNWGVTKGWKVTDRYGNRAELEARALYEAITRSPDGVLPWIKKFW